ncbi:MAG: TolC family protein, partial [Prevotella sp.]|nr:TolC family protein [Prevotella sp.]
MKTRLLTIIALCPLLVGNGWAQQAAAPTDIETIIASVEANNTLLKAVRSGNAATVAEVKSENTIGETSVEYSPFFRKGVGGTASSELIVSQEFDFPTVYGARSKSASLRQNVLDHEYAVVRREVLLEAQGLYYDLLMVMGKRSLLNERRAVADSLLAVCEKRMKAGDTNVLEYNKVGIDRMTVMTEATANDGEVERIRLGMERLGLAPELLQRLMASLQDFSYWDNCPQPSSCSLQGKGAEVSSAEATLQLAEHDVRLSQMGWLPKLTVGYRRNTEYEEAASNGFLVGVSVPLFSNSKKVSAARMRKNAAEQQLENTRYQTESRKRSLQA